MGRRAYLPVLTNYLPFKLFNNLVNILIKFYFVNFVFFKMVLEIHLKYFKIFFALLEA